MRINSAIAVKPVNSSPNFDHTRAVEPLERSTQWQLGEVEETFPSGL